MTEEQRAAALADEIELLDELSAGLAFYGNATTVWADADHMGQVIEIARRAHTPKFQHRVHPWLLACFGAEIAADREERNHRFLEESLELVQALGCTRHEAHQLVDYVFGRPDGEPAQEVGGVMVTLAALCLANSLDMHEAGETELARIWTKVEQIRAKQAAKPKHSPLPQHVEPTATTDDYDDEDMAVVGRSLMRAIHNELANQNSPLFGWHPAQCPSEVVGDLIKRISDLAADAFAERKRCIDYLRDLGYCGAIEDLYTMRANGLPSLYDADRAARRNHTAEKEQGR